MCENLASEATCGTVVVITTAQLHSTKLELRFCAGSNPAHDVSDIRDNEDLWQLPLLEIKLNTFRRSILPVKQFIFIIMIITVCPGMRFQVNISAMCI